jgi:hypothetical protein
MKLYSLLDTKAECYGAPFLQKTKAEAIRGFIQAANDPETMMFKHPADYVLYELGIWNEDSGEILPHNEKLSIGSALDFKKE